MANEITVGAIFSYSDSEESGFEIPSSLQEVSANVSTKKFVHNKIAVGTSEEALPLGEVSSLGYAVFVNRDGTNFVTLRLATGASTGIEIPANGAPITVKFASSVTAPYVIADTAACQLEYWLVSR